MIYKKIKSSLKLSNDDLKLLIEQEYHKKLWEEKENIKKSKQVHSKLPLISQLYFLRNPIKKYNLLEYDHNEGIIYQIITGTKTELINAIKSDVRERLESYNYRDYVEDKVDTDYEVKKVMPYYENEIKEQIENMNLGNNLTTLISQKEMNNLDEDHSEYYIITPSII